MKKRILVVRAAGVTFDNRQSKLQLILRRSHWDKEAVTARLIRDKDNEHDPNAIAIIAKSTKDPKGQWFRVGFLPKATAQAIAPVLDAGGHAYVNQARIVGGGDGFKFGLQLTVAYDIPTIIPTRQQILYA